MRSNRIRFTFFSGRLTRQEGCPSGERTPARLVVFLGELARFQNDVEEANPIHVTSIGHGSTISPAVL
jgi:hypothetical protein